VARIGAHLSTAGGAWRAAVASGALGCEALQVFLRAPGRWEAAALTDEAVRRFREASEATGLVGRCFAHAPYLLNLASYETELRRRSIAALADELQRAGRLGLAGVVLHPGSARGGSRRAAEVRCRAALAMAIELAGEGAAPLLLEGSAGSGGQLGRTPEELVRLLPQGSSLPIGVCLDLAHLWACGYDLLDDGWEVVLAELASTWGKAVPDLLHGNDTNVDLGSRRDRHAPPGEGKLGERFFRALLADGRTGELPIVVEIPPGKSNELVASALDRLRSWRQ